MTIDLYFGLKKYNSYLFKINHFFKAFTGNARPVTQITAKENCLRRKKVISFLSLSTLKSSHQKRPYHDKSQQEGRGVRLEKEDTVVFGTKGMSLKVGKMKFDDLDKSARAVMQFAFEAGSMAQQFCTNRTKETQDSLKIVQKQDDTPVTIVDKEVNQYLVHKLMETFEEARVIGEECIKSSNEQMDDFSKGYVFFVDPIDGTKEFISNNGEWAVMIGLTLNSKPILGVIYRPSTDSMYYGIDGKGSYEIQNYKNSRQNIDENKNKLCARNIQKVEDAILLMSRSNSFKEVDRFKEMANINKTITMGSFAVKSCLIAAGIADVYFNPCRKTHFWDTCAGEIILNEAGACLLTDKGTPIQYSGTDTQITDLLVAFPCSLDKTILIELIKKS